jgi:hypothetical protein
VTSVVNRCRISSQISEIRPPGPGVSATHLYERLLVLIDLGNNNSRGSAIG